MKKRGEVREEKRDEVSSRAAGGIANRDRLCGTYANTASSAKTRRKIGSIRFPVLPGLLRIGGTYPTRYIPEVPRKDRDIRVEGECIMLARTPEFLPSSSLRILSRSCRLEVAEKKRIGAEEARRGRERRTRGKTCGSLSPCRETHCSPAR